MPFLVLEDANAAVWKSSRRRRTGVQWSDGGACAATLPATCSLNPSHQLLHPHVQHSSQSDERAQAQVHRGAGAGLVLLELLVGVGGDAGGVGQGFLAQALSDAGAL